jgi:hypothetical protein
MRPTRAAPPRRPAAKGKTEGGERGRANPREEAAADAADAADADAEGEAIRGAGRLRKGKENAGAGE